MSRKMNVSWPKTLITDGAEVVTVWVPVGVAFVHAATDNAKERIDVRIDAIPLNWDGRLCLFATDQPIRKTKGRAP